MIISQEIEIILNKGNIPLFKKFFPDKKIGDMVIVNINDISSSSLIKIEAECDFCHNRTFIEYKKYNRSIKNNELYSCSKKCSSLRLKNKLVKQYNVKNISMLDDVKKKIKNTNVEKYGSEYYFGSQNSKYKIKKTLIEKYNVDNPQKDKDIRQKTKNTNLIKYGASEILASLEIRDKIAKTNIERYGSKTPSSNDLIKSKICKTNNEKYGFNSPLLNADILKKSKATLNINYQVCSPLKSEIIKNRCIQTNLKKYGINSFSKTDEFKEKIKNNNLNKYGVDSFYKTDEFKQKSRETNLEKYGVDNYSKTDEFKQKSRETNLEKYGVITISQNEIFRKENFGIAKHVNYIKYLENGISLFNCDCQKEHQFEIKIDDYLSRIRSKIPLCTICYPISENNSIKELEILNFIKQNYLGEILPGWRDNLEIDIYLPELKLGFEFNGLYWHSEEYKENNYHLNKTLLFKEKDIRIIHIFEDDWDNKKDIICSQIKNYLGVTETKIFARKCSIKEINAKDFLDSNHIQGNVKSVIKLGLFYNNELVSVMSFDNFEGRIKMEEGGWNLSRFCNKLNCNVIGGASKLLSYFIKTYNPSRIISYADRSWSEGNLYYQLGFKLISESKPDYKYIINGKRIHKSNFKMKNEKNEMLSSGIKRIYDCGKLKFEIKKATI